MALRSPLRSCARCRAQRTHYRQGLRCSTGSIACECAGCARAREHHKSDLSWRTSGRPDHSQPAITREQPSQPAPVVLQVQRFGSFVVRLWLLSAAVTRHTARTTAGEHPEVEEANGRAACSARTVCLQFAVICEAAHRPSSLGAHINDRQAQLNEGERQSRRALSVNAGADARNVQG